MASENNRYRRSGSVSSSSRYSRAESFRTGSRYADKRQADSKTGHGGSRGVRLKDTPRASRVTISDRKAAARAAEDTATAARAAAERALVQAEKEQAKVEEAKKAGQLMDRSEQAGGNGQGMAKEAVQNRQMPTETAGSRDPEIPKNQGPKTAKGSSFRTAAIVALAGVLVLGYIVTAVIFSKRFYPGTTIYGINCAAKSADWVKAQINEKVASYTLTLEERGDIHEALSAGQVNLKTIDGPEVVDACLKEQMSALWPVMIFVRRGRDISVQTSYDQNGIEDLLSGLSCFKPENVQAPEDAYITISEGTYQIVPENEGTTLNMDKVKSAVMTALDEGDSVISLDEAGCYEKPEITQDDEALNAQADAKNLVIGADITIDFGDRTERVDTSVIDRFLKKDEETGGYLIDPDQVWTYVSELADKYDTFGGTRTFYSSIGTVETLMGGDYGWAMDQDATAQALLDDIRAAKKEVFEPIYTYTAKSRNENDIGGTYVEICISRQTMWCYQDGYLAVETPVVTGNPNRNNATPSGGVWAIDAKMTNYTLVGQGYRTPVDYWMPFNGNVGIHDLQSRYYFGGTIYLSNGSHGCVNTPLDAVEEIYNIVSIGTPVVVYE